MVEPNPVPNSNGDAATPSSNPLPPPGLSAATPTPAPASDQASAASIGWVRGPRPGDLTLGWRTIVAVCWIGVIIAWAAVWNVSVQLGLSTWWLGPRGDPQPRWVNFVPFVAPVAMLLAAINQLRYLAWWGLGASAVLGLIAVGDLFRVASIGVVEMLIVGAAVAVSLASLSGTYRRTNH